MRPWRRMALVSTITLVACAVLEPKETAYLQSAEGRATQSEVRQNLGPPALTKAGPGGEHVWVYQIREQQPGNRITSTGMWCDEYVLTFDSRAVLKKWSHQSYYHGGELEPTYCVPGGVDGK